MARVKHTDVVIGAGAGVVVSLLEHGTSTAATLWAAETGEATVDAVLTNDFGHYSVWLDEGEYDRSVAQAPQEDDIVYALSYASLLARIAAITATPGERGERGEKGAAGEGAAVERVSSLPGSPVDGEEVDYVASSSKGIIWRLRYRSAGTTHKWEFVGGSPLATPISGDITTSSSGGVALTSFAGLTAPLAGEYRVTFEIDMISQAAGGNNMLATVFIGGSETSLVAALTVAGTGQGATISVEDVLTAGAGSPAGVFGVAVRSANSISTRFVNARMSIVPVKVG